MSFLHEPFDKNKDDYKNIFRDFFKTYPDKWKDYEYWMPVKQTEYPQLDSYSTENQINVKLAVPGFEKDQLSIELTEQILKVSGTPPKIDPEYKSYNSKEIVFKKFERSFILPKGVSVTDYNATLNNGILHIVLDCSNNKPNNKKHIPIS